MCHVAAHRAEIAIGIKGEPVLQCLDRGLQRGERRAQVVADRREQRSARLVVTPPGFISVGEPLDHRVERHRGRAQLVAAGYAGAGE